MKVHTNDKLNNKKRWPTFYFLFMYTWRLNMTSKSLYFCQNFVFGEFVVASSQSRNKFRQFITIILDQLDWQQELHTAMTALHDVGPRFRFGIQYIYTF